MFRKAFETLDEKSQTKDELLARLLKEESEILVEQAQEKLEALNMEHRYKQKSTNTGEYWQRSDKRRRDIEEAKKNSTCNICKVKGHWARECPNKAFGSKGNTSAEDGQVREKAKTNN